MMGIGRALGQVWLLSEEKTWVDWLAQFVGPTVSAISVIAALWIALSGRREARTQALKFECCRLLREVLENVYLAERYWLQSEEDWSGASSDAFSAAVRSANSRGEPNRDVAEEIRRAGQSKSRDQFRRAKEGIARARAAALTYDAIKQNVQLNERLAANLEEKIDAAEPQGVGGFVGVVNWCEDEVERRLRLEAP